MKRLNRYITALMLAFVMLIVGACGERAAVDSMDSSIEVSSGTPHVSDEDVSGHAEVDSTSETEAGETTAASITSELAYTEPLLDEDGIYDSKDDVSLYLHIYGKLPSNYITKKEAKKLGWSGGSVEAYAPGKCIGGDYFGNYEGLLPEDNEYHECDIDTLGKKSRGAKRIIYSDDGYIYYTEDHYETFELLYEP